MRGAGDRSIPWGMAGVYALAGHPHLFNEDGVRVDLVRRDPELLIEEEDGRLRVRIDPHREHDRGDYRFARVGDARYEVTRFGAAHKEMMDVIPAEGIELPVEARERLVGAVSGLAGEFRVQGTMDDEAEDEAGGRRVPADPHPWVRLAPRGGGSGGGGRGGARSGIGGVLHARNRRHERVRAPRGPRRCGPSATWRRKPRRSGTSRPRVRRWRDWAPTTR